ncbi:MAG: phosphotransferase [Planctomycetaceae bacterium]|nr:phosphotransferase [Planctomycetaceae bacterium]
MNSAAALLCRHYPDVRPVQVAPHGESSGLSGAAIWRVTSPRGDFALRRWPSPSLPAERILGLHRLLHELAGQGLNFVSAPRYALDGSTLAEEAGLLWQLEPWLPGTPLLKQQPDPKLVEKSAHALARWHLAAAMHRPLPEVARWFATRDREVSPAVGERRHRLSAVPPAWWVQIRQAPRRPATQPVAEILDQLARLGFELWNRVDELLRLGESLAVPTQPVLRDVWADHVLFENGEVTGLIDAAACRRESVAADLARLFGSIPGMSPSIWEQGLDAYASVRPLSREERQLVGILDSSGVFLAAANWLERLVQGSESIPVTAPILARLTQLASRMEELAGAEPQSSGRLLLP